ncbi:choline/ethanolamine kinase family protein [Yinghuangia soli]|uniref:Phosphotransferase family protein n=1 Tax=Yinghuangia soli TaxID=2908204 RepID=A0AA41PYA0_9ACTN|nr:choline/ethanolamine kinase family protein [Yinghuangia soli]MCF2528113.1 phosphotransferase family protein [Yinghuangia soli]
MTAATDDTGLFADLLVRAGLDPGPAPSFTPLTGGLSHRVLRVDGAAGRCILRILDPGVSAAGLGVPGRQEIANTAAAARSGVGPRVLGALDEPAVLVLEFVEGRTLEARDIADPGTLVRIAAACRRLHARTPRFGNGFDIFRKAEELLGRCLRHGLPVPPDYPVRLADLDRIEAALAAAALPPVPCHNDLLPANFIDDGRRVRIVDYQLSGMNDPAFELGDIAAEAQLAPDAVEALTAAYFGAESSPRHTARVRLNRIASDFAWTLWFSVHHGLLADTAATPAFDYGAEAADKWARAVHALDAADFGRLLDRAAGRNAPPAGPAGARPTAP